MKIEILTRSESVKHLGQQISFHHQETTEIKNRIRAAWATFRKYRQELTSKNDMLNHRLRLFDAAISPTICYAAGTWTPNKEHGRMIQSTQRKMLRLIIQTKKRNTQRSRNKKVRPTKKSKKQTPGTRHKKKKWKLSLRIATSPSDRWLRKAADWNPELSTRYRINRAIGRPRKRWEDDINEFLKQEFEEKESEEPIERRIQNNNNWINIAKDWRKWARLEGQYTMNCVNMTEYKKRRDDDLEQSSSSANALRNASSNWKHFKQQQHSGQEHCEGGRTRIKKYVTGSQQRWKNLCTNFIRTKEEKLGPISGTTATLWYPAVLSPGVVASPGVLGRSSLPGFLLFCYFCGVAPNPRIL